MTISDKKIEKVAKLLKNAKKHYSQKKEFYDTILNAPRETYTQIYKPQFQNLNQQNINSGTENLNSGIEQINNLSNQNNPNNIRQEIINPHNITPGIAQTENINPQSRQTIVSMQQQIPAQQIVPNIAPQRSMNTPINVIAKNYISPETISNVEQIEKKIKKTVKLAKLPDNLIQVSSTDWQPINYRGVNERYKLWKLSEVEIVFDKSTQKLLYKLIEPELTEKEKEILEELKKGFMYIFERIEPKTGKNTDEIIKKGTIKLCTKYGIKLNEEQFEKIVYFLERDFLGLEIIEPIMHDKYIEDISCDGLNVPIFVNHLKYGALEVNRSYTDGMKLNSFIIKLAQKSNQEVSLSKPILQGALPDGSRVEAIYGKEISEKGSSFTIRKFRAEPFTPIHLIDFGTMPPFMLAYLWLAVENKQSILISGGTATGKTTILNALSLFVPPTSKIVSIEDTPEINLPHEHWLPLVAREREGKADVSMFDLLKASLRERPDYIIVGEIRGKEAAILFQGMATGHAGLGTVHAEKFSDLVNRMTIDPINLPKPLLTELNLCIFMNRIKIKENLVRRASSIIEIIDYDSVKDKFLYNEFVKYDPKNDNFEFNDESYIISHLLKIRGGKEDSLWSEIEKRRRILDLMHKKEISEYRDVSMIIKSYYKDPINIFNYIENYNVKKEIKKEN